jgi:hypothetical protein
LGAQWWIVLWRHFSWVVRSFKPFTKPSSPHRQNADIPRVCEGWVKHLLQQRNANDEFLAVVDLKPTAVCFNTSNFPKTEVSSGIPENLFKPWRTLK